jgi:Laminin N-terminal (Domain VI)
MEIVQSFFLLHLFAALRLLDNNVKQQGGGLWPAVFNVAANAKITANATCGQQNPEDFCKMVDAHPQRYAFCSSFIYFFAWLICGHVFVLLFLCDRRRGEQKIKN